MGYPKIIHFNGIFHYTPSFMATPIYGNLHIYICLPHQHLHATSFVNSFRPMTRPNSAKGRSLKALWGSNCFSHSKSFSSFTRASFGFFITSTRAQGAQDAQGAQARVNKLVPWGCPKPQNCRGIWWASEIRSSPVENCGRPVIPLRISTIRNSGAGEVWFDPKLNSRQKNS